MRTPAKTIQTLRASIAAVLGLLMLLTPFSSLAQEATPSSTDASIMQVAPAPGALQITLTGSTGLPLSGSVAVTDSAGIYQDVWVGEGFGQAANVSAGTATVIQVTGTADYAVDSTPMYVEIPEGGIGYATITNVFLDADGDGIGDSIDACPAGNDAADTDGDGIADACDSTPNGDPTPSPTAEPTIQPTLEPTATATIQPTVTATPAFTPTPSKTIRTNTAVMAASDNTASVSMTPGTIPQGGVTTQFTLTLTKSSQSSAIRSMRIQIPSGFQVSNIVSAQGSGQVRNGSIELDNINHGQNESAVTVTFTAIVPHAQGSYAWNVQAWTSPNFNSGEFLIGSQPVVTVQQSFQQVASCILRSATNKTTPGNFVMYQCSTNGSKLSISIDLKADAWRMAYVFSDTAGLQPSSFAFDSLSWTASDLSTTDTGGRKNVYIFVTPTETAAIGEWGTFPQFDVQMTNPSLPGNTHLGSTYFQFFRDIAPDDFSLSCSPDEVTPNESGIATVSCEVAWAVQTQNPEAWATFLPPTVPSGWKVVGPTQDYQLKEWHLRYGTPFVVTFTIERLASTPDTPVVVPVNAIIEVGTYRYSGLTDSVTIGGAPASSISASITSTDLAWNQPYSHVDQTLSPGSLTYRVDATGSAGWDVNVSATAFTGTNGGTIPASNLLLTDSSMPEGQGLSRPVVSGTLENGLVVLRAAPGNGSGSFSQTLNVSMTVPGGTPADTYTSVITITATSAPQN